MRGCYFYTLGMHILLSGKHKGLHGAHLLSRLIAINSSGTSRARHALMPARKYSKCSYCANTERMEQEGGARAPATSARSQITRIFTLPFESNDSQRAPCRITHKTKGRIAPNELSW